MLRFRNFIPLLAAVAAGVAILGMPPPARAGFQVTLHEAGFTDMVITDNGANDFDTDVGVINFSGAFGDFRIQSDFATTTSGDPTAVPTLTINQVSVENKNTSSRKTLTITVQDDEFGNSGTGLGATLNSQLSTTSLTKAGDSVAFQSFLNGVGGNQISLGTAPSGTEDVKNGLSLGSGSTFTLADVTTLNISAGGTIQSTGTTTVTPAPAGLVLALSGLPFLGFGAWLRRRRKPE